MTVVTHYHLRQNLDSVLEEVVESKAPVIVTRENAASVVMVSLQEWEGMEETLYLMSSARNAEALLKSIAQLKRGDTEEHELIR